VYFIEKSLYNREDCIYLGIQHHNKNTQYEMKNLNPKAASLVKKISLNVAAVTYILTNINAIIKL